MDSNDSFSLSALEAGEGNFPHPGPHPPIHPQVQLAKMHLPDSVAHGISQMAPYPGEHFDPAGLPPAGPHPVFPPQCGGFIVSFNGRPFLIIFFAGVDEGGDYEPPSPDSWVGESGAYPP